MQPGGYLKSICSGILLILSWPPVSVPGLLFIAWVPLLSDIISSDGIGRCFKKSFLTVFIWSLGVLYWILMIDIQMEYRFIAFLAFLLIPLFLAVPFVLGKRIQMLVSDNKGLIWLVFPCFWVANESIHSAWELSFNWLHMGFGISKHPAMMSYYRYTGVSGGSFLVIAINTLLALSLINRKNSGFVKKALLSALAMLILAPAVTVIYDEGKKESKPAANVLILQPNLDPYKTLDFRSLYEQTRNVITMAKPFSRSNIDLIVAPEGYLRSRNDAPIVINELDSNPACMALRELARELNTPVLSGMIAVEIIDVKDKTSSTFTNENGQYFNMYNAAVFIPPDGEAQVCGKDKLVPFMERVPFVNWFPFLEKWRFQINQSVGSYSRYGSSKVFEHGALKVAVIICMEAQYHDYVAALLREDQANLLAVISNDGWTGMTSGPGQNASYSSALAAATGKPVVRSANTGVSAAYDEDGYVLGSIDYGQRKAMVKQVSLRDRDSFFVRYGNILAGASLAITLLTVVTCIGTGLYTRWKPLKG